VLSHTSVPGFEINWNLADFSCTFCVFYVDWQN